MNKYYSAILAAGSTQLFWYLSIPVLTRIYSPSEIGLYGLFTALTAFISLGISARSDIAILGSDGKYIKEIFSAHNKLGVYIIIPISFVLIASVIKFDWPVKSVLLCIVILFSSYVSYIYSLCGIVLIKNEGYVILKKTALTRSLVQLILQLIMFAWGGIGLILGKILADILILKKRLNCIKIYKVNWNIKFNEQEKNILLLNKHKYGYAIPQKIINSVSQMLPMFFVSTRSTGEELGFYTIAFMLAVAPIGLLGTPIHQILYRDFSNSNGSASNIKNLVKKTISLIGFSVIIYATTHLIGERIIIQILGQEWSQVFEIMMLLLVWSLAGLVSQPSLAFLLSLSRHKEHLIYEIIVFVGRVLTLNYGFTNIKIIDNLYIFIIWNFISLIAFTVWIFWLAMDKRND